MIPPSPNTNSARGGVNESQAVTSASSVTFATALVAGQWYRLCATTNIWFTQANSGATAAKNSTSAVLCVGDTVLIDGACGASLGVIADVAGGFATLTKVRIGR